MTLIRLQTKALVAVALLFPWSLFSQSGENLKKISSSYDRSSITLMYMQFGGEGHAQEVKEKVESLAMSDKFYNNNLGQLAFTAPFSRSTTSIPDELKRYLAEQKVGHSVISKWYDRQDDGTMSMDLIFERGMFNATDAAFIKAQSTKLGNALLQDYGNRLIERSYILVLDFEGVKTMKEAKMEKVSRGWQAIVRGYLFKINYSEEMRNAVYDSWIYPEDSPATRKEKNRRYEQLEFPVDYITQVSVPISSLQPAPTTTLGKILPQLSDDELLVGLVQKGYDEVLYSIEKTHEDFMVKTTIYQTGPIRAKIGKKEGLRCDNRYFVYEYVYDEKNNTSKAVMRGVIRATSKIADNREVAKGDTPTSQFYQTAGRRLHPGFLLRQQNDMGIEVLAGYESGKVGGIHLRIDARIGKLIGNKSLFLYVDGGGQAKEYKYSYPTSSIVTNSPFFYRYSVGLAKGFMLLRNLELRPYLGVGQEIATYKDWESKGGDLEVLYAKVGANLALNLRHNIQVVGGFSHFTFIGSAENENGDTKKTWGELFKDRGGLTSMVGLKIMF